MLFSLAVPQSVLVAIAVVLFAVGVAGGIAGTLLGYCCWGRVKPHTSLPPVYEEISLTSSRKEQEFKLDENVAYGHMK